MSITPSRWNSPSPKRASLVSSMADWQSECFVPQNPPALESMGAHPNRALQSTSGNVQSFSDHIAHCAAAGHDGRFQPMLYKYPQPQPHPHPQLHRSPSHPVTHSSLHQQALAARLHAKKLRRVNSQHGPATPRSRRDRNYLKSQKYLEYRARPRRDTGKDGEAVWSDELEDAFQQGM